MVSVDDPFLRSINALLARLTECIQRVNQPADLAGLASFVFLRDANVNSVKWNVHIPTRERIQQYGTELDQAPQLAILGYLIFEEERKDNGNSTAGNTEFMAHVQRLVERQNIFTTPNSWMLQPTIVLGITLGVLTCRDDATKQWLQTKLHEGIQRTDLSLYLRLLYRYGLFLFQCPPIQLASFPFPSLNANAITLPERALTIWLVQRQVLNPPIAQELWFADAQANLLEHCLSENLDSIGDEKAALLYQVLATYIHSRSRLPTLDLVQTLLTNFLPAMERWQPKWEIADEYDVQAILWLILRTAFGDVRYEEHLPKRGRSGHRYDIGIPILGLLVEAKYVYEADEFQKIVDAIGKDAAQITTQKSFTGIFVFVYDASRSSQHHDWARKAILDTERISGCVIVSAPSHLPETKKRIKRREPRRRQILS